MRNAFTHWRGLASRYDKLARANRGEAVLTTILPWLGAPQRPREDGLSAPEILTPPRRC